MTVDSAIAIVHAHPMLVFCALLIVATLAGDGWFEFFVLLAVCALVWL